jgi:hypothetical protein
MAIVQNPLIGRAKGKFANAIFSTVYDQNIIRSKPLSIRDRKSVLQLKQRSAFALAVNWIIHFLSIIRAGFASVSVQRSAYASAISYYLTNCIEVLSNPPAFIFSAIRFTNGDLLQSSATMITDNDPDNIAITFATDAGVGNSSPDDVAIIILFNETDNTDHIIQAGVTRADGAAAFSGFDYSVGDVVHIWLQFRKSDNSMFSTTQYCGTTTLEV